MTLHVPYQVGLARGSLLLTRPLATKGTSVILEYLVARRHTRKVFFSTTKCPFRTFHFHPRLPAHWNKGDYPIGPEEGETTPLRYHIPQRVRHKLVSATDAVALIRDNDTVCVSGFVTQGAPEAVLKALGDRFDETESPRNLTLLFGGGPGDFGERGLSHLAKTSEDGSCYMLRRTIGGKQATSSNHSNSHRCFSKLFSTRRSLWASPQSSGTCPTGQDRGLDTSDGIHFADDPGAIYAQSRAYYHYWNWNICRS
jgi:hypothetical protein